MKILVTGGGGQLANALVRATNRLDSVECLVLNQEQLDITSPSSISARIDDFGPSVIINAAAYTAVDRAEEEEAEATLVNGQAVGFLAESARRASCKLVHVSTDFVFDGTGNVPILPAAETNPISAYGRSKLAGEVACREVLGDEAIIVRTSWVYDRSGANFVNTMLRLLATRDEIGVVADQIGTPTFAGTLASGILKISESGETGIFHLTDSGVASWYDLAIAVAELGLEHGLISSSGRVLPISTSQFPTPATRPSFSVLDKSRTFEILCDSSPHWRASLNDCLGSRLPQN
jgi:dTDP-4-dehydrorhamnose reductase